MIAERLRNKYRKKNLVPTSLSIGVAELLGSPETLEQDLEALIDKADRALYLVKNNGGNQVSEGDR